MQSIISFNPRVDSRDIDHYRRDASFWKEIALIDLDRGISAAEARFYGSGNVVYCVLWVRGYDYDQPAARGYGKAGGYGYHKPSAALAAAFEAAGITLSDDIGGRGDGVMFDAMKALGDHLGIKRSLVHTAHA